MTPSNLPCLARIPTVNLTAGCAHGCIYCYTRGYRSHPGQGRVVLYSNTLEKLQAELPRKGRKPLAVYFSPSSDLFQPVPEVLAIAYDVLAFLFKQRVGVAFLTKGRIPPAHMALIRANAHQVRAQIGLTTLDPNIAGIFEPQAAVPTARLSQVRDLVTMGVETQVRLDPILPGLTDSDECLDALCAGIARTGVKVIAANTLFLRPAVGASLRFHLKDERVSQRLLSAFSKPDRLAIHMTVSAIAALPREVRSRTYNRLRDIAGRYKIALRLCACKNPDMATGTCNIAGNWNQRRFATTEPSLFDATER